MFLSRKHNVVVYNGNAAQIAAQIPDTTILNESTAAVPFELYQMQLAKFIGLPALSPMETTYKYPGRFKPHGHQKAMAAFMTLHPRCFNFSAMRTGKTMSCVWAADYLMELGYVRRALVVCTLSNMERVWERELYRHMLGIRSSKVLYGDQKQRLDALAQLVDFYVVNHDGLCVGTTKSPRGLVPGPLAQELAAREDIDLVIVDEATAFKHSSTRRFKVLAKILKNKPYVWLLTGTPTPQAPTDGWALKKLLAPNTENYLSFRDRTMIQVSPFKWVPRREAPEVVSKFLQPAIRFSREDCIDIPPITIETVECPLSSKQKAAYDSMKKDLAITVSEGRQVTAVNEAVLRMKLIQISLGAIYGADREVHYTDAKPRIDLLLDILEEADSKIIVFAPLTSVVHLLYSVIKKAGFSCEKITGDVSSGARNRIFQSFTDGDDPHVIVADPGTVAHGLDLCAASTVVWFGPTDKLETYQQANARIDGINQKRKMVAIQIASTPVEKEIYKRLEERRTMQGLILDMVRQ